jgi:hypothetical protein
MTGPGQQGDPQLTERERAARDAIRAASARVRAPAALRARIDAERDDGAAAQPTPRRWTGLRLGLAGAGAAALAAIAVAVVVLAGGGEPSVAETAEIASQSPTQPAPAASESEPTLLAASFEGLAYPDWSREFGWRAIGERDDELDGRDTHTVFYENDEGARIAYTIVAGEPLDPPDDAQPHTIDGVDLDSFEADGAGAVTWLRDGHTCVLAGESVDEATLLKLAAWKGDGAVTF